jgi:tRNA threonylcarbamoyladenosine biosynthesis protein TsaE
MDSFELLLQDEKQMQLLAAKFAKFISKSNLIYLSGDLGAGKTTFVRYVLNSLGVYQSIKSPTYTLVEQYETKDYFIYHFDLYRISDPNELIFMGFYDYLDKDAICFIEWPEKGKDVLPEEDLNILFSYAQNNSRIVKFESKSEVGKQIINLLKDN